MWSFRWPLSFFAVVAVALVGALILDGLASLFFWVLAGTIAAIGLAMTPTAVNHARGGGGGGRTGFID